MPTPFLPEPRSFVARVDDRSGPDITLLRTSLKRPLLVGDSNEFKIPYRVDSSLYDKYDGVWDSWTATARAFVDGELVEERVVSDLQNF